MDDLSIAEIMSAEIAAVPPEAPLAEILCAVRSSSASCVVVCEDRIPSGVITHVDLIPALEAGIRGEDIGSLTALDIMSFPAFTLVETELMSDAMAIVSQRGLSNVPVVNESGEVTGLIRLRHLLVAHANQLDAKRESLEKIVNKRTEDLLSSNNHLQEIALIDPLTKIGNRRAMSAHLQEAHEAARQCGTSYSVLMIDLDHFKKLNDLSGHLAGDITLRETVRSMHEALREVDQCYRYGGEEFLAVLPQTGLEGALEAGERVRSSIEARGLPHPDSPQGVVTVSCGVAAAIGERGVADQWSTVVSSADAALYRAKESGRNRVST